MHGKFRGKITNLSHIAAHKKSEIKPYPEEIKQNSQIEWLLKKKRHGQARDNIQLWQNRIWNYYVSAYEWHT